MRPANSTDALRALGALCVLWYHNPAYWLLPETSSVDAAKLIILGWSMPFFYATSAKFALLPPSSRIVLRIGQLARLVVLYFVVYEAFGLVVGRGVIWSCLNGADTCSPISLFNSVRTVGGTPGYYLSDVITLLVLGGAFVAVARWIGRWAYGFVGLGVLVLLIGDPRLWGLFLNPLAFGCLVWASIWWMLLRLPLSGHGIRWRRAKCGLPFALGLMAIWGLANFFWAADSYWRAPQNIAIFGALVLVFLSLDYLVQVKSVVASTLSVWGQRYSLGFLLIHQLCFDIAGPGVTSILISLGLPDIATYVILGLVVTGLTGAAVVALERHLELARGILTEG